APEGLVAEGIEAERTTALCHHRLGFLLDLVVEGGQSVAVLVIRGGAEADRRDCGNCGTRDDGASETSAPRASRRGPGGAFGNRAIHEVRHAGLLAVTPIAAARGEQSACRSDANTVAVFDGARLRGLLRSADRPATAEVLRCVGGVAIEALPL